MDTGIRARTGEVLTLEQIRPIVPSLFATTAHESRSQRYVPIPSIDVVTQLIDKGFQPVEARQSLTRDTSKRDFAKHMIRFRSDIDLHDRNRVGRAVGDVSFEIILRNASDGSAMYEFMAGLFRLACLNGMVLPDKLIESVKVRHSGDRERVLGEVVEGAYTVLDQSAKAIEAPKKWGAIELSGDERSALAEAAHVLRFGDAEGNTSTPIEPRQLLIPRRPDDVGNDLWRTFNTLQENSIRGGISAIGRDRQNRPRRSTTREVRGIDGDIKLNKGLWLLADRMAELKA